MSETATPTAPEGSVPAGVAQVPEGYVPVAEVEAAREESRRRYQSELDQVKAELSRLRTAPPAASAGAATGESKGFDPESFRSELLRQVSGVMTLGQAASELRAEFPHADPALFTPDGMAKFSTPDALRFAAQDSHARVAAILDAERAKIREELAAEVAGKYGTTGGAAGTSGVMGLAGDPTPQQLAEMPLDEFNKLDPEVIERVMTRHT